jgi:hypothetical protein
MKNTSDAKQGKLEKQVVLRMRMLQRFSKIPFAPSRMPNAWENRVNGESGP